jgi:hypothetical protein
MELPFCQLIINQLRIFFFAETRGFREKKKKKEGKCVGKRLKMAVPSRG